MKKFCLFVLLSLLACPAFSQSVPGSGTFGLAVSMSGIVGNNVMTLSNGLSGVYWIDNHWVLGGGFGLASIADNATIFSFGTTARYHFNKNQLSPLVGGGIYISVVSPSGAGTKSTTQFGFLLGGGAEYFFAKGFGIQVTQGIDFHTEPTTFAFSSRIGLEWYF